MTGFTFLLASSLELALIHSAQAKESKPVFRHLVDVDYAFFLTRAKLPWGIDPFIKEPGFAKIKPADEKFELNGILYSKDHPMAIINGKSLGVGSFVGERSLIEIGENYVILKKEESEIEINLPPLKKHTEQ